MVMDNLTMPEDIFRRPVVQLTLIVAYSFVFFCCFFGNLLVIAVVCLHKSMRTNTNFFLLNLAIADLCVGVFCVYQNLTLYLATQWAFGDFLCKMYHFVHSLSYTASVLILAVISVERYFAVLNPIGSKRLMTRRRLRWTLAGVWVVSAAYCSPRLVMYGTRSVPSAVDGLEDTLCILLRSLYDSRTYDIVNFAFCFVLPLSIITVLYTIICLRLRKAPTFEHQFSGSSYVDKTQPGSAMAARRKAVRLLVAVVLTFAMCNLPFHARKLWQSWSPHYDGSSTKAALLTIATTLILYLNCGLNPILYAFLSGRFRRSMARLVLCRVRPASLV